MEILVIGIFFFLKHRNFVFIIFYFSPKGLPCTIGHIEANPLLKGTHTMGVLLGEFPLKYEAFDNTVASGIRVN